MVTIERGPHDGIIMVEVSNRPLPIRMIAGRLRNELRHSRDCMPSRIRRRARLAAVAAAALRPASRFDADARTE